MRRFQKLSLATTIAAVGVVTIGALVRSSGSGLGCPDWPRCHGRWIPPFDASALIEYSHRLSVSLLGVLGFAVVAFAWLRFRQVKSIFRPAMLAVAIVLIQAWVGRLVVKHELPENLVGLHFFIALALLAVLTVLTVNSFWPRGGSWDGLARRALVATGVVFVAMMAGALVSQAAAALVFPDWPLMSGRLIPVFAGAPAIIHFTHRLLALAAGAVIATTAMKVARERRDQRSLLLLSRWALVVWGSQVLAGAAGVLFRSAPWAIVMHVFLGACLWVTSVALTALAFRRGEVVSEPVPFRAERTLTETVKAYFLLTKPRIIELLLITTLPAMIVAAGAMPSLALILATLLGGSLAAGSANAINCYFDRDIDERMERTSSRPLPQRQIEPASALRFGIVLGVAGVLWLVVTVNWVAALLALGAILFYVFVYTLALKRTTPSNIVIGGAAGGVPVLVAWAAVKGTVEVPALVAFAIIFYWTPPHFWALSLRYASEYEAAGVPMLPVVRGAHETTRQILFYSSALFAVSLLFLSVGRMGILYFSAAVVLGVAFIGYALRLRLGPTVRNAVGLFRFSIAYLTLLFVAMGADRLLGAYRPESIYGIVVWVAALVFFAATAAILVGTARWRKSGASRPEGWRAEVGWTVIPTMMVGLLFLSLWRF